MQEVLFRIYERLRKRSYRAALRGTHSPKSWWQDEEWVYHDGYLKGMNDTLKAVKRELGATR